MANSPDVLVIGGGIIGLTSAYFLAKAGLSVEVVDRGDLGKEASWAGAGIIPPGNPDRAATPIDKLRAIGSAKFPALSQELQERTGIENGYLRSGGVEFLQPHDEDVLPDWEREGIRFEHVPLGQLRNLYEPGIGEVAGKPFVLPDCAQVRNPWHLRALIAACETLGVQLRPHVAADHWVREGQRLLGLRLANGDAAVAGHYLVAAGAWSEDLLQPFGHRPGVVPVRGQIVLLNGAGVERVLMSGKQYMVPRGDGRILIGSTEEPEAGFDNSTTAEGVVNLIGFATRTVPGLAQAAVEKTWAGLRPGSPDGKPFIGPVPGYDTVYVAVGHFRAGVQLSIGTAELVRDLITGANPAFSAEAFRLDRVPDVTARPAFRS